MKIPFIILAFLLIVSTSNAELAIDKKAHAAVSGCVSGITYVVIDKWFPETSSTEKFIYSTLIGMIPGVAKELYDSRSGGSGWSNEDLIADFIGSAGVPATMITLKWEW